MTWSQEKLTLAPRGPGNEGVFVKVNASSQGDKYYRFDPEERPPVKRSYPKPVENWEGIPGHIDDALQYKNGYTYFFKQGGPFIKQFLVLSFQFYDVIESLWSPIQLF